MANQKQRDSSCRRLRLLAFRLSTVAVCLFTAACAGDRPSFNDEVINAPSLAEPTLAAFGYCSGHGCETLQSLSLNDQEWAEIAGHLLPVATSAAQERGQVADAVASFERIAGGKAGTAGDLGGTWPGFLLDGQLDCVDETMNTQTLLRLLDAEGLLAWHQVAAPAGRGSFFDGLPHRTAVLTERDSGSEYAIDSWFYENGRRPEIVHLASWLGGWRPDGN